MKRVLISLLLILPLISLAIGCEKAPEQTDTEAEPAPPPEVIEVIEDVTVLFTGNTCGGLDGGFDYSALCELKNEILTYNENVLLVDLGGFANCLPTNSNNLMEATLSLMSAVGYDLAVAADSEFVMGVDTLLSASENVGLPFVSANFIDTAADKSAFEPYKIFDIGERKIAFVGVSAPTLIPLGFIDKDGVVKYSFCEADLYERVQGAVDSALGEGAELVILLSNLGNEASDTDFTVSKLISNTNGIDAVLDGMTSSDNKNELFENSQGVKVPLFAPNSEQGFAGCLELSANGDINARYIDAFEGSDTNIAALVNELKAEFEAERTKTIAKSDSELIAVAPETDITVINTSETNLGNLIADAYKYASGADVTIVSSGEIACGIPAGDINVDSILCVIDGGATLNLVRANGSELLDCLEIAYNKLPEASLEFLSLSGITLTIDMNKAPTVITDENGVFSGIDGERRVTDVVIGGEPLDVSKTYLIAYSSEAPHSLTGIFDDNAFVFKKSIKATAAIAAYLCDSLGGAIGEGYSHLYGEDRIRKIPLGEKEPPKSTSDLPQIYITTKGNAAIKRTSYISCAITIHDPTGVYSDIYDEVSTIKIRGNSTSVGEKAPYNIKFESKQDVLGLGTGKKWNLLANMYDKTQFRNMLAFEFADAIGVNYVSSSRFAEVYVNGEYRGMYQICEPIGASPTRVDIDLSNNEYLLELEPRVGYSNDYHIIAPYTGYIFGYNEPEKPTADQQEWLKEFLKKVETALYSGNYETVKKYIDVESFARNYIVQELFKQVDYNTSSTRFYVKDGKLYEGPIWDFDLSSGNCSFYYYPAYNNDTTTRLSYQGRYTVGIYNIYLFRYSEFKELVALLYKELQPNIVNLYEANELGQSRIDELLSKYQADIDRNNTIWSTKERSNLYEHVPVDGTYEGEINYLRDWLKNRNEWLYDYYCK